MVESLHFLTKVPSVCELANFGGFVVILGVTSGPFRIGKTKKNQVFDWMVLGNVRGLGMGGKFRLGFIAATG